MPKQKIESRQNKLTVEGLLLVSILTLGEAQSRHDWSAVREMIEIGKTLASGKINDRTLSKEEIHALEVKMMETRNRITSAKFLKALGLIK